MGYMHTSPHLKLFKGIKSMVGGIVVFEVSNVKQTKYLYFIQVCSKTTYSVSLMCKLFLVLKVLLWTQVNA